MILKDISSLPEGADRQREDPVAQQERTRTGVEDRTRDEPGPDAVAKPRQVASVARALLAVLYTAGFPRSEVVVVTVADHKAETACASGRVEPRPFLPHPSIVEIPVHFEARYSGLRRRPERRLIDEPAVDSRWRRSRHELPCYRSRGVVTVRA
jgi:hypothetical protein